MSAWGSPCPFLSAAWGSLWCQLDKVPIFEYSFLPHLSLVWSILGLWNIQFPVQKHSFLIFWKYFICLSEKILAFLLFSNTIFFFFVFRFPVSYNFHFCLFVKFSSLCWSYHLILALHFLIQIIFQLFGPLRRRFKTPCCLMYHILCFSTSLLKTSLFIFLSINALHAFWKFLFVVDVFLGFIQEFHFLN